MKGLFFFGGGGSRRSESTEVSSCVRHDEGEVERQQYYEKKQHTK